VQARAYPTQAQSSWPSSSVALRVNHQDLVYDGRLHPSTEVPQ